MSQKLNVTVNKMATSVLNKIGKENDEDSQKKVKDKSDSCVIDSISTVEGDFEVVVCTQDDIKEEG